MTQDPKSRAQPFTFDRVFDGDAVIEPIRPKRSFTPEEYEAAKAKAFADGERSAAALAEAAAARSLAEVSELAASALSSLQQIAHAHREACAELALAAARKIAGAALERFPSAPAEATLQALAGELPATARLIVRIACEDPARLSAALAEGARRAGFEGQIALMTDAGLPGGAFMFDWGEGRASFDAEAATLKVEAALRQALEAERPPAPLSHQSEAS